MEKKILTQSGVEQDQENLLEEMSQMSQKKKNGEKEVDRQDREGGIPGRVVSLSKELRTAQQVWM